MSFQRASGTGHHRRTAWLAALLSVMLLATACAAHEPSGSPSVPTTPTASGQAGPSKASTKASTKATAKPRPSTLKTPTPAAPATPKNPDDITLAFAGDANAFKGGAASTTEGLGEAGRLLAEADFAMVNLETALADDQTGLTKQPKLYTFITDSTFPQMLEREGVDLIGLANNHAMDFGVEGMNRTLAIKKASTVPMIGVGQTEDEAFAPWQGTVKGRAISVFVGNDILESNMDWRPRDGKPGVAMIKTDAGLDRLVNGVAAARKANPDQIIAVYVHWGIDYQVCTSSRQQTIARRLAQAGATVVVGTHAHRVQRTTMVGSTLVAYGLGNFNFYSDRVQTRETGVLTVTIPTQGKVAHEWAPGKIVDGRPVMLTGTAKENALARYESLSC